MKMASSKSNLTEDQLYESIIGTVLQMVVKGKLAQIQKMGIPQDLKDLAADTDKKIKKAKKSIAKAKKLRKKGLH